MKSFLNEPITILKFDHNLNDKLQKNNILTVEELWSLTRKELKKMSFTDHDIHKIIIGLELHGLDLGKRIVKL